MHLLMAGRPVKRYSPIKQWLTLKMEDGTLVPYFEIFILCPICHSHFIGSYGVQNLKTGTYTKYQCKNPNCPARKYLKKGKQFFVQTSAFFKETLADHLKQILMLLMRGDMTQKTLGQQVKRSPALMTYLRHKVEKILAQKKNLEQLILKAPLDNAVSLDEMFLTIEGHAVYIIMATSYGHRKVLGIKVAESRDEHMMRTVFDEAERNNGKPFSILTIDAWGGSIKMAKSLLRPITLVIHKHKAPYKKAVIWKIEYEENKRIIHQIGVNTNIFTTRHKRKYHYMKEEELLVKPMLKRRGRPKGVKNGHGKKKPYVKKPKNTQKKRGPKGIFRVFEVGKLGYAKIDPGKKVVKLAKGGSTTVGAVLNQVIQVFAKMTIQNNLAENKNSVVEHRVWLSGPKDLEGGETRIRAFLFYLNNPEELPKIEINHHLRGDLIYAELERGMVGSLIKANYLYQQTGLKIGGLN